MGHKKVSRPKTIKKAAKALKDPKAKAREKSLGGSVLSQAPGKKLKIKSRKR